VTWRVSWLRQIGDLTEWTIMRHRCDSAEREHQIYYFLGACRLFMRNGSGEGSASLAKSILHNIGVVIVGFGVALIGARIDSLVGIRGFASGLATAVGCLLLGLGFLLRVWATFCFYEHRMKVISLEPQKALITSGPYGFSRNPLYLGGNVFIFFGAALSLGSPAALVITAIHIPLLDLFIRREERQLEEQFGEAWVRYKHRVRRWI
jgi:protein-S-isoprenylcysteine O-methyltransferase Ste14